MIDITCGSSECGHIITGSVQVSDGVGFTIYVELTMTKNLGVLLVITHTLCPWLQTRFLSIQMALNMMGAVSLMQSLQDHHWKIKLTASVPVLPHVVHTNTGTGTVLRRCFCTFCRAA